MVKSSSNESYCLYYTDTKRFMAYTQDVKEMRHFITTSYCTYSSFSYETVC